MPETCFNACKEDACQDRKAHTNERDLNVLFRTPSQVPSAAMGFDTASVVEEYTCLFIALIYLNISLPPWCDCGRLCEATQGPGRSIGLDCVAGAEEGGRGREDVYGVAEVSRTELASVWTLWSSCSVMIAQEIML